MELLLTMAHWHGLAKMRVHNDRTLEVMDALTTSLGDKLRAFSTKTCPAFATRELRREFDARIRRQTKRTVSQNRGTTEAHVQDTSPLIRCASNSDLAPEHDADDDEQHQSASEANAQTINQTSSNPNISTAQVMLEERRSVSEAEHVSAARRVAGKRIPGRRHKTFNLGTYKLHSFGDYVRTIRQYGTMDSFSTEPVRDMAKSFFFFFFFKPLICFT
jgi:hypothetical protein